MKLINYHLSILVHYTIIIQGIYQAYTSPFFFSNNAVIENLIFGIINISI